MLAYPSSVLLATLKAGTQCVLQADGVLAGNDGILTVGGVAGLGVNEGQLKLLLGGGCR